MISIQNGHVEEYYLPPLNLGRPRHADVWVPILASCIQHGIVVVPSAGNLPRQQFPYQGWVNPQRFASPHDAIITVGSIDRFGGISAFNLPINGPSADGSFLSGTFSVYALGEDIRTPNLNPADPNLYKLQSGTSLSAPIVAGLAAYYLTLPNTVLPAEAIRVPMAVKDHIVQLAREKSHDRGGAAYNGVRDALCGPINTPKRNRSAAKIMPFNETDAIDPEAAWKEWISMGMDPDEFSAGE